MCLESARLFPRIAKEDIEVGKKLCVHNGKTFTWYLDYPVTSIMMKTSFILLTILKLYLYKEKRNTRYLVEEGVIHSFNLTMVSHAFKSNFISGKIDGETLYVRAIIPKGALYYKDYWGHTYASNKLILKPSEEQLKYFRNK